MTVVEEVDSDSMEDVSQSLYDDLESVFCDEGVSPLAVIEHSQEVKETLGRFQSLLTKEELSERALLICESVINLIPAHYTAWWYRRRCVMHLKLGLKELEFVRRWSLESPKNYQVWYHRRCVVEMIGSPLDEMEKLNDQLKMDQKNYSIWGYRQWLITTFSVWSASDLDLVEELLEEDCRNNSAWSHRHFLMAASPLVDGETAESRRRQDLGYTMKWIEKTPHNESAWAYLNGFFFSPPERRITWGLRRQELWEEAPPEVDELIDSVLDANSGCRFALEARAKSLHAKGLGHACVSVYKSLMNADPIRQLYWEWKLRKSQALNQDENQTGTNERQGVE